MKKFFSLLLALATIGSASASVILHESFDREVGTLNKGTIQDNMGTNTTDWWCFSGDGTATTAIQIVEGTLSYSGYVSESTGKQVKMSNGFIADDLRQFNSISSGKIYAAAIINIDAFKESTSNDYFLALGDASASDMWARLYIQGVKDNNTGTFTGYKLGITKFNETSYISYIEKPFAGKDTLLVVLEYEFVDGEKNDIARLYINPTAKTTTPDAISSASVTNQKDAAYIRSINLRQGSNTPTSLYVDEIKVATEWADLFEGGGEDNTPVITVQDNFAFETDLNGYFAGDTYTGTLIISGKNLTEDITLSSSTDDITFASASISKSDAEAEGGTSITATLVPSAVTSAEGYDIRTATITLTSGEASTTLPVAYSVFALNRCADIASLKATVVSGEPYTVNARFVGNGIITYIQSGNWSKIYTIEDKTGAINIEDELDVLSGVELGDVITDILGNNGETNLKITPFIVMGLPIQVVSKNQEIEPQVVTLAELQANPEEYLLELVQVKGVAFDETDVLFSAGNFTITQGEYTANVNILAGNTLIGEAKPAKANVTGVSSAANGQVLRPRWAEDIVKTDDDPTGIEEATFETGIEIYTIQGMRVESLQPGVNIIRKGNTIYKVVR